MLNPSLTNPVSAVTSASDLADYLKERNAVIEWLISIGCPPLSVAPAQDPKKYYKVEKANPERNVWERCPFNPQKLKENKFEPTPLFTGKNPSYLDQAGEPHLLFHTNYQEKLPQDWELKRWFANPANGIGTLGGWNDTSWIDFDAKNFDNQDECDRSVQNILDNHPQLKDSFIERTHSGGWRIGAKATSKPEFVNFCLTPGGKHVGEALGAGRFTVLAPTIGPSGNPYRNIHRGSLVEIGTLESIGIYPAGKAKQAAEPKRAADSKQANTTPRVSVDSPADFGAIPLDMLITDRARLILNGDNPNGDRSAALATLINESYGWERWCQENEIVYRDNTEILAEHAGEKLGLDARRITAILEPIIATNNCEPAAKHTGGDLSCWKKIRKLNKSIFEAKCPDEFKEMLSHNQNNTTTIPDFAPQAEKIFTQIAYERLYSDKKWVCIDGSLYYWKKNYYELSDDNIEKKRIRNFCNSYAVPVRSKNEEKWVYSYANPASVNRVFEWVKQSCGVAPDVVNPPGINCTNGVLEISWEDKAPKWQLVEHDPERHIYISEPSATYNPKADSTACNAMLECLDVPQRDIFLKTAAASLNLEVIRKYKGRAIRSAFCKGDGNNGKDTLREALKLLQGKQSITSCTTSDFEQYDKGRKFPLAKLAHSRVNWASENQDVVAIDKLQSLKACITGESLDIEIKGKTDYSIETKCVFFFNMNGTPNLAAAQEAIESRYSILEFKKTYKDNPDPTKGELKADPRFKYDPDFLKREVLPAFLNRVLDALVRLMGEGIDYSCTRQALEEVQEESNHLYLFSRDVGLGYLPNGKTYAGTIWEKLTEWYIANGTLSYEITQSGYEKAVWVEQANPRDKNVKGPNQVIARFTKLFPKAKRSNKPDKHGYYLTGIGFQQQAGKAGEPVASSGEPTGSSGEPKGEPVESLKPLPRKEGEPGEPISPLFAQLIQNFECNEQHTAVQYEPAQKKNLEPEEKIAKIGSSAQNPDCVRLPVSPTGSPLVHPMNQLVHPESSPPSVEPSSSSISKLGPLSPHEIGKLITEKSENYNEWKEFRDNYSKQEFKYAWINYVKKEIKIKLKIATELLKCEDDKDYFEKIFEIYKNFELIKAATKTLTLEQQTKLNEIMAPF